ncbi:tRNA (uridine(54)-C5)-methyltransferase TrmA [Campylobacter sp. MIT 97-5078]|uniref:tRNA (uridine(54)-C5)-methyltransferase TrmA n=1 Tax=Campylobacter sp. MIT 97-5078 TaxID=1548153 RepID=UPI000512A623|nr:tRNA (uridine(54)-C5)-methyltransferase TrmA [Campylobacter sp. MIT 97-5078]KGI55980.1 tRNA (uracil-5-)-methyltransferase [Campylobacter sp. MIT 97-5078]KGI57442.1 tRNA (uracil-5-)-methyltransferase [Campylobacter sp. MIT 97-5078]KGI57530.1 tRNA (uracil-5-)-methyltransferase [Campylobacter sp. MIT 97-5078]TQR27366.1 tRNA (uridine(54)-C5)-methyltransferase TrmA [Campylobacter sp. MIT 97-5078]
MSDFIQKSQFAKELFKEFLNDLKIEEFQNHSKAYRNRVELVFYKDELGLSYASFEGKKKIKIQSLDFVEPQIQSFMPLLLVCLNASKILSNKLFGVEFLSTKKDFSITLLYHTDINLLQDELDQLSKDLNTNIITRCKGKKLVFGHEELRQSLDINGYKFEYIFSNDCFVQPNTFMNETMISWVINKVKKDNKSDLLEFYCGYGNFTLPLSRLFHRVLASEISKKNIEFALQNCKLNQSQNINFIRLSSQELIKAFKKERAFFRLRHINLDEFEFSHVFVDPPRAGLDELSLEFIPSFKNIIYISCNPLTLKDNLNVLSKSHKIKHFAIFDQFAHTPHLECGVILERK